MYGLTDPRLVPGSTNNVSGTGVRGSIGSSIGGASIGAGGSVGAAAVGSSVGRASIGVGCSVGATAGPQAESKANAARRRSVRRKELRFISLIPLLYTMQVLFLCHFS